MTLWPRFRHRWPPLHRRSEPAGSWPVRIVNHPKGGLGVRLDNSHGPYMPVMAGPVLSPGSRARKVQYPVEVCDHVEVFSCSIDGVTVNDFVTPEYANRHAARGLHANLLGWPGSHSTYRAAVSSRGWTRRMDAGTRGAPRDWPREAKKAWRLRCRSPAEQSATERAVMASAFSASRSVPVRPHSAISSV